MTNEERIQKMTQALLAIADPEDDASMATATIALIMERMRPGGVPPLLEVARLFAQVRAYEQHKAKGEAVAKNINLDG